MYGMHVGLARPYIHIYKPYICMYVGLARPYIHIYKPYICTAYTQGWLDHIYIYIQTVYMYGIYVGLARTVYAYIQTVYDQCCALYG